MYEPAAGLRSEKAAAGPGGSQGEKEDDQDRDRHDSGLAADDRGRDQALASLRQRVEVEAGQLALGAPERAPSASSVTSSGSVP